MERKNNLKVHQSESPTNPKRKENSRVLIVRVSKERNLVWYVVIVFALARAIPYLSDSSLTVTSAETAKLSDFTAPRRPPNKPPSGGSG